MASHETVNIQGTDAHGALIVKVYDPLPMNAVDRGRLYAAAPMLVEALQELVLNTERTPMLARSLDKARFALAYVASPQQEYPAP